MKKYFAALSTTALVCVAPHALANSTTDLTVTGLITPIACTPSFSNGGLIDVGAHSVGDLDQDRNTLINTTAIGFTMTCDGSTLFTLKSIDNKEGTAYGTGFGVGLDPDGKELGQYIIRILSARAENVEVQAIGSSDNGTTWAPQNALTKDSLSSVANTTSTDTRIPVEVLNMDLEVITYIARADGLNLTDEVEIDGSATIEVGYN